MLSINVLFFYYTYIAFNLAPIGLIQNQHFPVNSVRYVFHRGMKPSLPCKERAHNQDRLTTVIYRSSNNTILRNLLKFKACCIKPYIFIFDHLFDTRDEPAPHGPALTLFGKCFFYTDNQDTNLRLY